MYGSLDNWNVDNVTNMDGMLIIFNNQSGVRPVGEEGNAWYSSPCKWANIIIIPI